MNTIAATSLPFATRVPSRASAAPPESGQDGRAPARPEPDPLLESLRRRNDARAQTLERVNRAIDTAGTVVGTAFWGATGAVAGGLAGLLTGSPVGLAVGAAGGAAALGTLYLKGHGDRMGKLAMAGAAVATGAMFGAAAAGPTGAAIGGGLGLAYGAAGLWFTWNE